MTAEGSTQHDGKKTRLDMNEASAEYLTLRTRQQPTVTSLSLAAQSARSILSVF